MHSSPRGPARLAATLAPIAICLAFPADAQTASSQIIPLPLKPIVSGPQRTCTTKTSSGLGYTALRQAVGAKPTDGDVVLLDYIGYLAADGSVFDQGQRAPLAVTDVIAGFTEGLKLMSRGAIFRVCIPATLGYGAKATGPIPANSDLVFQIELLDFKSRAEIEALRKTQAAGVNAGVPKPNR